VPAYQDLLASRSDVTSAATHSAATDSAAESDRRPAAAGQGQHKGATA